MKSPLPCCGGALLNPSPSPVRPWPGQVVLRPVEIDAREAVKTLVLDPDQEQFAGPLDTVFDGLQDSRHHDSQHAFAVVAGNEMVGFFILREKSALPNWAPGGGITLHSFRIRRDCQGMGFGKAAVGLAICWVRHNRPDVSKLMLAVNARNLSAKSLYLKSGLVDEGAIFHGPIGDQNILTFHLKNAES